jgi:hypothetical protein
LTFGLANYSKAGFAKVNQECSCEEVKRGLAPSFVFSEEGEIGFQSSLCHLAVCQKKSCLAFKQVVFAGIKTKLDWLMEDRVLLGCHFIRPYLYRGEKIVILKKNLDSILKHLGSCDTESCAKLRRAVLLRIRDEINVF